jgi:hypothetical protein
VIRYDSGLIWRSSVAGVAPPRGPIALRSPTPATCRKARNAKSCKTVATRAAREAVAVAENTDWLDGQGDAYADLAEVLTLASKPDEAGAALEQALARYRRKGNLVSAHRTKTRLAELGPSAPP